MKNAVILKLIAVVSAVFLFLPVCSRAEKTEKKQTTIIDDQKLPPSGVDMIVFGSPASEQTHGLSTERSETTVGALGEAGRRLLPLAAHGWEGGKASFKMKVDPERQNYFTARFSGDEVNENYLILFCEGKQLGYRHLGDIDVLALPDEAPRYNGRFYYVTTPLPLTMTQGRKEVSLEIRAIGKIWGYGQTFAEYQNPMIHPSRVIYRLYTHTDGAFTPSTDEKQGQTPEATKRTVPGAEVITQVKEKVNETLDGLLKATKPLNQMQVQFLAKAYFVSWTHAFQSPKAVAQVVDGVDELYKRWKRNPKELWQDKATWNPGWFGVGPGADAVRRLAIQLASALGQKLDGDKTRRVAWSEMFQSSRDWLRNNRRWLTNQAMFTDVNLYLSNRGVAAIDPAKALPEEMALDYLYQSVGLVPWLGKDTPNGPEKLFGNDFYQVTQKGLTRERGYAGGYGEGGVDGTMDIYDATRGPNGEGDPKIKEQLAKMLRARGPFRYPMLDDENHLAMRLETAVGWRDTHLPGDVIYAEREGGEHSPLQAVAATLDSSVIGYAQQMFAENQFFAAVDGQLKSSRFRSIIGLLDLPGQYELLQAQPASPHRLPMGWDQPDFVFSDEEDGVVAIKNGREILYVSLYWRAGYAINSWARTHYLTPNYQQVAVVREDAKFEPSGRIYKRPDWINFGFGDGGTHIGYPADLHQAFAGEELPIAKIPADVKLKPGEENHFAGKANFYTLRYGPYLIGMNMTQDKTFELKVPDGAKRVKDLVSQRNDFAAGSVEKVGPRSTVVLYFDAP